MKIGISILCVALIATSSAGFVNIQNIDSGVRSLGLGSSLVAVADNSDAVFINPAGLGQLMRRQVTYTHGGIAAASVDDLGRYMASFGMPLNAKLGLGLGYERIGSSLLSENGAFVSLSYQALSGLYMGVSTKYLFSIWSRLDQFYAGGREGVVGVDVGLLWQSSFSGAQMGLFLRNANQPSTGESSALTLPTDLHVGAGYRVGTLALLSVQYVRRDVTKISFTRHRRWMVGVEGYLLEELVLRVGRQESLDVRGVSLSMGLGYRLGYRGIGLLLDYAYRENGEPLELLSAHRFSLACEF